MLKLNTFYIYLVHIGGFNQTKIALFRIPIRVISKLLLFPWARILINFTLVAQYWFKHDKKSRIASNTIKQNYKSINQQRANKWKRSWKSFKWQWFVECGYHCIENHTSILCKVMDYFVFQMHCKQVLPSLRQAQESWNENSGGRTARYAVFIG